MGRILSKWHSCEDQQGHTGVTATEECVNHWTRFSKHCCSNKWYSPFAKYKRSSDVLWWCSCSHTLYGMRRGVWCNGRDVVFDTYTFNELFINLITASTCLKWKNQNIRCLTSLRGGEARGACRVPYLHYMHVSCGFNGYLVLCPFWLKLGDRFVVSNRVWFSSDECWIGYASYIFYHYR